MPSCEANVVQRADVRMAQAGYRVCFSLEALTELWLLREMLGQNLYGYSAIQPGVVSAVYLSHTPDPAE